MFFFLSKDQIKKGVLILGIFSLAGFLSSLQFWFFFSLYGDPISLNKFILESLAQWYTWALLVPVIQWIAQKFPIRSSFLLTNIFFNLIISAIVVIGKTFIDESWGYLIGNSPPDNPPFVDRFLFSLLSPRSFMVLSIYWTIMAIIYILQYNRKLREQEITSTQLEAQLAQAQLDALKIQIQPHFLFNTLNSISSLLRENVDAADDMITHLSDMLRYSLSHLSIHEVSLRKEIEFLQHYLDIEQIRFQDRLRIQIDIDPSAMEARVPSMFLQPIVENSIRHGIAKQAAPGTVTISARCADGWLEITVSDTGAGFSDRNESSGIGLSNTRKRLEKLYDSSFTLRMERTTDHETVVRISIPYSILKNP